MKTLRINDDTLCSLQSAAKLYSDTRTSLIIYDTSLLPHSRFLY